MSEHIYYCALCGCLLDHRLVFSTFDSESDVSGIDFEKLPAAERSIKWLSRFSVLLLKAPIPTSPAVSDDLPTRAFLVKDCAVRGSLQYNRADQVQIPDPEDPDEPFEIGVYDYTPAPFPGIAFPFHHACYNILNDCIARITASRGIPADSVTIDDIHEALSDDYNTHELSVENLRQAAEEGWDPRHKMEYPHRYYVTANRERQWFDDCDPGLTWWFTDPLAPINVRALLDGFPRVSSSRREQDQPRPTAPGNPFHKLPPELIAEICRYLPDDQSLLSFRGASRAIRIPQYVYRDRILEHAALPELEVADIDWEAVLARFEEKDFTVFDGDITTRNKARICKIVWSIAEKACGPMREARERGERPSGPDVWCPLVEKEDSKFFELCPADAMPGIQR